MMELWLAYAIGFGCGWFVQRVSMRRFLRWFSAELDEVRATVRGEHQAEVLRVLAGGEKHGREIRESYQKHTGPPLSLAWLYRVLAGMETSGLVTSRMGETAPGRDGNRRKYFSLTELGRQKVKE